MYDNLKKQLNLRNANIERYYPDVISNAKELKSLSKTIDKELDMWIDRVKENFLNTFVYDLNKKGCERFEEMLRITPNVNASINNRRQQILAKINAQLPYTERNFQKILDVAFGIGAVTVSVDYNKYIEWLTVAPETQISHEVLTNYARQITPANLAINLRASANVKNTIYHGAKSIVYEHVIIGG